MENGKTRIAGWAWMLIGLAVMAYSKFIESRADAKLVLFFWVGVAFILFGAYKEFVPRLRGRQRKKELVGPVHQPREPEHTTHLHPAGHQHHGISPLATHQHVQSTLHPSHPYTPLHKPCPRCHQFTAGKARFCHNCGHRFF